MKLKDIFYINQGHQITDEEIYNSFGEIPIYTGNNDIKGYWNKNIINEENLPCITYPTKGFSGNIFIQNNIFDANNTAVLYFKEDKKDVVSLEYVKCILKHKFLKAMTSKENISYLNREIVEEIDIEIPDDKVQKRIIEINSKYEKKLESIEENIQKIDKIIYNQELIEDYKFFQKKNEPIRNILDYLGGNSGLTEEFIYINLQKTGIKYKVLSSTISNNYLGFIPNTEIHGKKLKILENKDAILVNRKGKAGFIKYIEKGTYTINDNVYLLFKKDDCKYDINLLWLTIAYRKLFLDYASNCDNGTWNMTGFFEHADIDIPSKEAQEVVVKKYKTLISLQEHLLKSKSKLISLMSKEILI